MATTKKRATASASRKKMIVDEGAKGGFTIIEVVLVLAIAGLIFLMVFLALPALQRSQKDTQRRNDMGALYTAVQRYQGNNNGRLPTTGSIAAQPVGADGNVNMTVYRTDCGSNNMACKLISDYVNGATTTYSEWVDPDGFGYGLTIGTFANYGDAANSTPFSDHMAYLLTGARCNGDTAEASTNDLDYVVV